MGCVGGNVVLRATPCPQCFATSDAGVLPASTVRERRIEHQRENPDVLIYRNIVIFAIAFLV